GSRQISGNVLSNGTITLGATAPLSLNLDVGQQFTQAAGTVTVPSTAALGVTGGTYEFDGGSIAGVVNLSLSSLVIGQGSVGAASFVFSRGCSLSGDVASGQSILVYSDDNVASLLTVQTDCLMNGTLTLSSSGFYSNLTEAPGKLFTIGLGGVLDVPALPGGS